MNNDVVVKVEHLSKRFKIYRHPWDRAKEWLTRGRHHTDFWALQDISFELRQGGIIAIIGRNGAGKSTLLKILTGSLSPTSGTFQIKGRVLSLFGLGTGFNPELTGRQNLFHSAELLALPEGYLEERLPDIEAFAELGDFFDRPFKFYSSGMRARLGFALFAFLDCTVLILDEILSAGDIFFRQKCFDRMDELVKKNTTIILATHRMVTVQQYCHQAIVLNEGQVVFQGNSAEAAAYYTRLEPTRTGPEPVTALSLEDEGGPAPVPTNATEQATQPFWPPAEAFLDLSQAKIGGERLARCTGVAVCDNQGRPCQKFEQGQWLYLYYEIEVLQDIGVPIGQFAIINERNLMIHNKSTLQQLGVTGLSCAKKDDHIRFRQTIKLDLMPGEYAMKIGFATMNPGDYARAEEMSHHDIKSKTTALVSLDRLVSFIITPRTSGLTLLHHGICNLPGECLVTVNSTNETQ